MRQLMSVLLVLVFLSGCAGYKATPSSDLESKMEKSGLDIDTNSNSKVDRAYGGWDIEPGAWVETFGAAATLADAVSGVAATTTHLHTSVYEPADATILKNSAIGSTVQAYSANLTSVATPGVAGTYAKSTGTGIVWDVAGGAGGGTIGGTLGSADNAIVRSDGLGGLTAQGSSATISDTGTVNIPTGQTYNINGSAHTHNYQPADGDLTTWASITPSANMQSLAVMNYGQMLTAIGAQTLDTDLTALAGLSGVSGDIIYRDATQWQRLGKGSTGQYLTQGASYPAWATSSAADQDIIDIAALSGVRGDVIVRGASAWTRLAKGTEGQVLKATATDVTWGTDNNDGGEAGISTWDEIGDSADDSTVALGGYKTIFTSTLDTGAVWTMTNTDASLSADTSFFDMKATSDGDANLFFMRGYDNSGGDLKWSIGQHGAFYGYSFETVQSATGGKLDLLEGSGAGTGYLRIKAPDDITTGTNTYTLSSSIADSEDLTIALGNNDNTVTLGSTTGAHLVLGSPTVTTLNGHTFTAGSSTFTGTAGQTYTFPTTTASLARTDAGQTFTGVNAFTAPTVTTSIAPSSADGATLGTTALEFSDLYLATGGVIYGENDQSNNLTSSSTGWTSSLDFTVGGADLTLGAAGVKLSGSNGSLTMLGLGDGQDEDLKLDFNTTANTVLVTSPSSSASLINFGSIHLATTGSILGAVNVIPDANGMSQGEMTTANVYGTMFLATGEGTWNLPSKAPGMSLCVYSTTAAAVVINPDDSDTIVLNGTALSAGDSITSASGAGDFVCLVGSDAATGQIWYTLGRSGTWTDTN